MNLKCEPACQPLHILSVCRGTERNVDHSDHVCTTQISVVFLNSLGCHHTLLKKNEQGMAVTADGHAPTWGWNLPAIFVAGSSQLTTVVGPQLIWVPSDARTINT